MNTPPDLSQLNHDQLRHLAATLMTQVEQQEKAPAQSQKTLRQTEQVNQNLTYELALLKLHAFGKRSEQLNVLQISLMEEEMEANIAAIETELEGLNLTAATPTPKKAPKRAPLPPELLRSETRHDPKSVHCGGELGRIGEKLNYTPGVFHVERHIRGKVGLRPVRDADPGADTGSNHRQGHPHRRPVGPGVDRQIQRSPFRAPPWPSGAASVACGSNR